jgi:hypothetical protein
LNPGAETQAISAARRYVLCSAITKSCEAIPSESRGEQEQIRKHAFTDRRQLRAAKLGDDVGYRDVADDQTVLFLIRRIAFAVALKYS